MPENIEDYLPFVKNIIAPYRNAGVPYEDLLETMEKMISSINKP